MSVTPSELERGWAVLQSPRSAEFASYPVDLSFYSTSVRLAVDGLGHRNLLIPCGAETLPPAQQHSTLRVQQQSLSFDGCSASYLLLCCTEPELNAEFDELILDVLASAEGSEAPAQEAARAVGRWRRLFRISRLQGLTALERHGLFAELSVLEELLNCDPSLGSRFWTGPDQEPHDFELPQACIEVKAVGPDSATIHIHGIDQLELHEGRPLMLVVCTVVADSDGRTLHELVESVRSKLPDEPLFTQQLAKARWSVADAGSSTEAYALASAVVVPVSGGLPRVVRGSLVGGVVPEGVSNLVYQVEVGRILELANGMTLPDLAREVCK